MITIYAWTPPFPEPGHISMQVGTSTYISFYPCENDENDISSNKKGNKKISFGITSKGFTYSDTYEEDCSEIGRKPEKIVVIKKLPEEIIVSYWDDILNGNNALDYNLIATNCAYVVGMGLEYAYAYYNYKNSPVKNIVDFCINTFSPKNVSSVDVYYFISFVRSKIKKSSDSKNTDYSKLSYGEIVEDFIEYTPTKVIKRAKEIKSLIKDF